MKLKEERAQNDRATVSKSNETTWFPASHHQTWPCRKLGKTTGFDPGWPQKKKKTARQHTHPQSTQSCHTPDWTYWGVFSEQVYGSQLLLRESPIVNTPSVTELLQDPGRQVMKEHTHWSACLNTAQPKQWVTRGVELCPVWPSVSHRHTHNQLTNSLTDASVIQV